MQQRRVNEEGPWVVKFFRLGADLMVELTTEKIQAMRAAGELPSEQQIANLAKTCSTLQETTSNLQATALGIDELVDMVDQELGE